MDISVFYDVPVEVQIHILCAAGSLFLGLYMLASKKGTNNHRFFGWAWVILMVATAVSATFIHQLRMIWIFSPIHVFVPITFIGLYNGVRHARAGWIAAHRTSMRSMYWGALCMPFVFTLAPTRVLVQIFGIRDLEWIPMALLATIVLGVGAFYRWENFWRKSIYWLKSAN